MRLPARIPILYLILGVLFVVGVVPLYIYGTKVVEINRERLITNEQLLQNTVTRSLAEDIAHARRIPQLHGKPSFSPNQPSASFSASYSHARA